MADQYEAQKASAGGLATIVFLLTSLVLFIAGPGIGRIFSLRGIGFILIGMFVSAIVLGIVFYLLQRGITKVLLKTLTNPFSTKSVSIIKTLGIILMIVQIGFTIWVTNIAFKFVVH